MAQQINIDAILKERAAKKYRFIPRFIIQYLERILHQDEINGFLKKNDHLNSIEFSQAIIDEFRIQVNVSGLDKIPKSDGCIVVCNHPLGGLDAMALVPHLAKVRKDIRYIVNDLLLNIDPLKELFVGVNKTGASGRNSLRKVEELFGSDKMVVLFPSGMVSRCINGKVQDLPWQKTFFTKAMKYKKPIIPIYINGELSPFFYRLSKVRKLLGIKMNIEMLYLANELFKQKDRKINFVVGSPIIVHSPTQYLSVVEGVQSIREELYNLAN